MIWNCTKELLIQQLSRSQLILRRSKICLFKGALQFPDYFGNNWDAFDECISDLSWLNAESFLIAHRDIPLASSPAEAATYLGLIENASYEQTGINFSFPLEFKKSIDNLLRNFAR
jgi:hypothetical protein